MTNLVDPTAIERIVGVERHDSEHWGRAVSSEQTVYILHSRECLESGVDLRECPYSVALDAGIKHHVPWTGWRRVQDVPVRLEVFRGWLVPDSAAYRAAVETPPSENRAEGETDTWDPLESTCRHASLSIL